MPTPIGTGYSDYIGTRASQANKNVTEFYDLKTGQGFSDPNQLAGYANLVAGRNDLTGDSVFGALQQGFTPRAAAIEKITQNLNQEQNASFSEQSAPKRQSSTLQDSINETNSQINSALEEFNSLKTRLSTLQAPNYQQEYNDLRTAQGIPQIEENLLGVRKDRRELPYVERRNTGNAGVATEGQLSAQTAQKDIPLEINEANQIDRLKLASDFVNNSLKFKELDANTSREALTTALNLAMESINLSRGRLGDLFDQQEKIEDRADRFRQTFGVTQRFYKLPGSATVYDAETLEPLTYEEYKKRGGIGSPGLEYTDTQEILPQTVQQERAIVANMASKYVDAGITLNDTLATAQAKLSRSSIYRDQVRGPQGPQASVSERLLLNQSRILGDTSNELDSQRSSSKDGFANPDTYRKFKREFIAAGGSPADFLSSYPVEVYISASNRVGDLASKTEKDSGVDPALAAWLGIK